jgi:hypothetical protein
MSQRSVQAAIKTGLAAGNDCLSSYKMDDAAGLAVVRAAVMSKDGKRTTPVTKGEAGLIEDLFSRRVERDAHIGVMMTLACPESPHSVAFAPAGAEAIRSFLIQYAPTSGVTLKERIEKALQQDGFDAACREPSVEGYTYVFLEDGRPVDGAMQEAYVDPTAATFYLKLTGAGMGGPDTVGPYWYGPLSLADADAPVGFRLRERLMALAAALGESAYWGEGSSSDMPLGQRFERVTLRADDAFDGYSYTAHVPVGALSPTAERQDPDDATYAYVERSGGLAGISRYVRVEL